MSACGSEPSVNNARIAFVNNNTMAVIYECLTGFYMTGRARVFCNQTSKTWDTPPTCNVIKQDNSYYNYNNIPSIFGGWWHYVLAGLLGLLVALLLGALLWCCSCCSAHPVYPYTSYHHQHRWCCRRRCSCHKRINVKPDKIKHSQQNNRIRNIFVQANNRTVEEPQIKSTEQNKEKATCKNVRSPKAPDKDNKIWMPHTHGVRNMNSTK